MVFLYAVETIIVVFLGWLTFTQVFIPMAVDEPLFPSFRWRRIQRAKANLRDEIAQVQALAQVDKLEDQLMADLRKRNARVTIKAEDDPQSQETSGTTGQKGESNAATDSEQTAS